MKIPQFDKCPCCDASFMAVIDNSCVAPRKALSLNCVKPECKGQTMYYGGDFPGGKFIGGELYWTCQTCGYQFKHEEKTV